MEIQTERLILGPIPEKMAACLAELLTDELVKQTYMVPDFPDRDAAMALAERIIRLSREKGRHVWGIRLENQLIGLLNETDSDGERVEVGYVLLPRFHNHGYCTEALRAVIDRLFAEGYRQVVAGAFAENAASIRVMVKSGMTATGHSESIDYRGKTHTCVYYAIDKRKEAEDVSRN